MNTEPRPMDSYQNVLKTAKSIPMIVQFLIFIIRTLVQRVFSVYIGIVVLQFIITTQINLKTYNIIESRFYIILNFVLIYLLTINFIQVCTNDQETIQNVLKDKYIINYVMIGYPLEFAFRFLSTLIIWREYQFSKMKNDDYDEVLPAQDVQTQSRRFDRIHVRENNNNSLFHWNNSSNRNDVENSRNLHNSDSVSQSNSVQNTLITRRIQSGTSRDMNLEHNQRRRAPMSYHQSVFSSNSQSHHNRDHILQNRTGLNAEGNFSNPRNLINSNLNLHQRSIQNPNQRPIEVRFNTQPFQGQR